MNEYEDLKENVLRLKQEAKDAGKKPKNLRLGCVISWALLQGTTEQWEEDLGMTIEEIAEGGGLLAIKRAFGLKLIIDKKRGQLIKVS